MKRTILSSIIGIAVATVVTSALAQGNILLNNYSGTGAQIFYNGSPLVNYTQTGAAWTIGIYGAIGNVTLAYDPTGIADPSALGPISLLSGSPGDTTTINDTYGGGYFAATASAVLPGYSSGTATFMVVAYSVGSTYDSAQVRGHSAAFNLTPATGAATPPFISTGYGPGQTPLGMPSFDIYTPEPSMFALSGIATAALLLVRRKK